MKASFLVFAILMLAFLYIIIMQVKGLNFDIKFVCINC